MELLTFVLVLCMATLGYTQSFNVMDYGAVGDGKTDDSNAFTKAWGAVCGAKSNFPTMVVPQGKTFLLKPVKFQGPCNSPNVHFLLQGNIVAPSKISDWAGYDPSRSWLAFIKVDGLVADGNGQIDGQGSDWWKSCGDNHCVRPTALEFSLSKNIQVSGFRQINSQRNHISIDSCNNATISNLHISAPEESPNTDGIDIYHSNNVEIRDCYIGTGDDCIAINSGSSYINISGIACGPGHGISIGSLGVKGRTETVEEVHVRNCNFTATQNGARIKTWQGGSGFARKISFEDISLFKAGNPIIIDQFYCPHASCSNKTSAVKVSDISFIGIYGTSVTANSINLSCSKTVGCSNIVLNHINITSAIANNNPYASCNNAHGSSSDSIPKVNCLL